ncbi:Alpha/Beta hydrolase protein [Suillus fuscotomentosus]|uniref:Alpha/Beta hydrolase protein n=1 Tax=Suillus fuscotomentosus TaxID=1912939 RepID=A0AAD4HS13_9AGAM|nr:Alpha/Beta hydrolase protein [Suillus fuscotomentosus]KAG1906642.1 Alpha/Beta hydrolase protein [Suillus fuscotomentosus]
MLACILQVAAVSYRAPSAMRRADVSVVTQMSSTDVADLKPYAEFARIAYCSPLIVGSWSCGKSCEALSDFKVSLTGGNDNSIQYYYVGYWPTKNTVVVAHEGTDPTSILAVLTDANGLVEHLDSTLFPGVDRSIKVHSGFADEHAKTASAILTEVKSLISQYNATSVTLVGHSLGAALAEIECVFMALNLPSHITIKGVTFGTPRVGNPAWAALFDSLVSDFKRVNHKKDIVPIVPGPELGYSHVHGEVHIVSDDQVVLCDDDSTDDQCTVKSVPNIFEGNVLDHLGPYQGIYIGYCPP